MNGVTGAVTSWPITALLTGRAVPFGPDGESSAIGKTLCAEPQHLGWTGFELDQQADLSVHGGRDKAVHHYPANHYPWWRASMPNHPLLNAPGAFGENIATEGLTEAGICIGDRFTLGGAVVEVSQGRQPCWKLGHRFGVSSVPALVVSSARSGWYYRVLQTGMVAPDDSLALIERPCPLWTVERAFTLLIGGGAKRDRAATAELAAIPALAESWAKRAHSLSASS